MSKEDKSMEVYEKYLNPTQLSQRDKGCNIRDFETAQNTERLFNKTSAILKNRRKK